MYLGTVAGQFTRAALLNRYQSTGRPARNMSGRPPLFIDTGKRPRVDPNDQLGWMIAHARELGLSAIEAGFPDYRNQAEIDRIGNLAAKHDVKLSADYWDNLHDPSKYKGPDEFQVFARAVKQLGIRFIGTGIGAGDLSRFTDDPPLERQMAAVVERLTPLARVAEAEGVYLAIENHADYRCCEIKHLVIDVIQSPNLGFKLDTGNCPLVIDDVLEATELAAPLCYATHFKDMHVIPNCPEGGKTVGAPIGLGSLKLDQVGEIIASRAPFPDELILSIEVGWVPPNEDFFLWFEHSVRWCHEKLGKYLTL